MFTRKPTCGRRSMVISKSQTSFMAALPRVGIPKEAGRGCTVFSPSMASEDTQRHFHHILSVEVMPSMSWLKQVEHKPPYSMGGESKNLQMSLKSFANRNASDRPTFAKMCAVQVSHSFFFILFYDFYFFHYSWFTVFVNFYCTEKWPSHTYTYIFLFSHYPPSCSITSDWI